jgi:hypothetical protein
MWSQQKQIELQQLPPGQSAISMGGGAEEGKDELLNRVVGFDIASDLSPTHNRSAYDERIVAFPKGRPRKAPK